MDKKTFITLNQKTEINMEKQNDLLGFLQGKTSTAIGRKLYKNLKAAELEMTQDQFSVLYTLWEQEGLTQQELSLLTFKDKPTITRLLDQLEKAGWVCRKEDPNDRRTNLVFLTMKAHKARFKALKIANLTLEEALNGISLQELSVCKKVLARVFDNLQET